VQLHRIRQYRGIFILSYLSIRRSDCLELKHRCYRFFANVTCNVILDKIMVTGNRSLTLQPSYHLDTARALSCQLEVVYSYLYIVDLYPVSFSLSFAASSTLSEKQKVADIYMKYSLRFWINIFIDIYFYISVIDIYYR